MIATTPFDIADWANRVLAIAVASDGLEKDSPELNKQMLAGADVVREFVRAIGDFKTANTAILALTGNGPAAVSIEWPQERLDSLVETGMQMWRENPFGLLLQYGFAVEADEDDEDAAREELREQLREVVDSAQQHYDELTAAVS